MGQDFRCICRIGNPSVLMPHITLVPGPGWVSYQARLIFAVEVRSENDYGRQQSGQAREARDYFACGTLVVWDVDLLSADVVQVYRASAPDNPTIFRRGDMAERNLPYQDGVWP